MPSVLILCTGNSCRSQMAEVIWRELGGSSWEVASAGSAPAGFVHPLAIEVLRERGLPTDSLTSKAIDALPRQTFDVVVTVCDRAQQACPTFPAATRTLHWPFPDPADARGTPAEQKAVFRAVADQIQDAIAAYLSRSAKSSTNGA